MRPNVNHSENYREALGNALVIALVLSALISQAAAADDSLPGLKLHAFGTGALNYVASGNADFVRDLSQPDGARGGQWTGKIDSLVGGQVNIQLSEHFEIVGQAVSRHRFDDSFTPELTWAFLKYSPLTNLDIRGGRIGTDFYMRSDSRLVGYSNLTIRPSVDYYGGLPHQYIDGMDGAMTFELGEGLLRSKVFAGISPEKFPLENSEPWNISGSRVFGGSLDYQWRSWQFRFGYAEIHHERDLPGSFAQLMTVLSTVPGTASQAALNALRVGETASQHYSMGVIYDEGPLQVQLMVSGVTSDSAFFQDAVCGYFLTGYRIGEFTPFAGLSWSKSTPDTLQSTRVPALDAAIVNTIGRTETNQHTFTLGVRWDFHPGMDLKLQWDAIQGDTNSLYNYRWEQADWDGRMQVLNMAFDFAF
ncbi:MAG: hypothetical protein CTY19_03600 [Methylomonas sp.]|nr:MAG: hypothetical protein CTY19_03600 [Methylomonas sp.]